MLQQKHLGKRGQIFNFYSEAKKMRRKNKKVTKIPKSTNIETRKFKDDRESQSESLDSEIFGKETLSDDINSELAISPANFKSDETEIKSEAELTSHVPAVNQGLPIQLPNETFLIVELKLISIDNKCINHIKLVENFLCINSNATINHLRKFIIKKMKITENFFDVNFN